MAFSVVAVLRQSLRRLATGPALLLLLALAVVQWLAALVPGQFVRPTPALAETGAGASPVIFIGNPVPVVASIIALGVGVYLALVTIRVFAGQWGIVEREHLTHRIGFGLANLFGLFVGLAVVFAVGRVVIAGFLGVIGVLLWAVLVLVLVAVAFLAPAFIAVEDDNLLTSSEKSIRVLTRSPLQVIGLLVALAVVNVVLQALGGFVVGAVVTVAFLESFALTVVSAVGSVFLWIAIARSYDHLDGTSV
jgi:hypothetical protein